MSCTRVGGTESQEVLRKRSEVTQEEVPASAGTEVWVDDEVGGTLASGTYKPVHDMTCG